MELLTGNQAREQCGRVEIAVESVACGASFKSNLNGGQTLVASGSVPLHLVFDLEMRLIVVPDLGQGK
jgi:hypothetical protein